MHITRCLSSFSSAISRWQMSHATWWIWLAKSSLFFATNGHFWHAWCCLVICLTNFAWWYVEYSQISHSNLWLCICSFSSSVDDPLKSQNLQGFECTDDITCLIKESFLSNFESHWVHSSHWFIWIVDICSFKRLFSPNIFPHSVQSKTRFDSFFKWTTMCCFKEISPVVRWPHSPHWNVEWFVSLCNFNASSSWLSKKQT